MLRHRLLALRARLAAAAEAVAAHTETQSTSVSIRPACFAEGERGARAAAVVASPRSTTLLLGSRAPTQLNYDASAQWSTTTAWPTLSHAKMSTEAERAAAASPPGDNRRRRRRSAAEEDPHLHSSPSFLDTRATPWVARFSDAQTVQEMERLVDRWGAAAGQEVRTLREAAAAATRLVALAEGRRAGGRGARPPAASAAAASACLGRVARAIAEPAVAASASSAHPAATGGGAAMSAAHLLWSHARLRRLPAEEGGGGGLGAALLTLAASGAGGRDATNPAAMALWASIRLAEAEQLQLRQQHQAVGQNQARRGSSRRGGANDHLPASPWRVVARRARSGFASLALKNHAGRADFGAPGGGDHSNHFNMAVWSFATVGPPYAADELRALELLLLGASRHYAAAPRRAPFSSSSSSSYSHPPFHEAKPLVSLLVGLGRLNGDVLPAVSARGVVGGKESQGAAGADAATAAAAASPLQRNNRGNKEWRSLGSEAVAGSDPNSTGDSAELPARQQPLNRRLTARGALAAAAGDDNDDDGAAAMPPSLRRALAGAAKAAAGALPASLASYQRRKGNCDGQMLASAAWGLAMCADVYDERAMAAVAAAVVRALEGTAAPAAAPSPSPSRSFRPEHFARLAWAFARKGHYAPEMMDAIARAAVPQMLAQAQAAAREAARRGGGGGAPRGKSAPPPPPPPPALFSVQNLANLAWGAASLGYTREKALYQAALACAAAPPSLFTLAARTTTRTRTTEAAAATLPASPPSSLLELDATPLHACNLLWAAASAAGGRAPASFVSAALRAVTTWDARQLPWSLAMQLLQAAGAGVEAAEDEGGGGGESSPQRLCFALPEGAREVLLATAERNKAPSIVSPFHGELAIAAAAATDLRWREWGRWLRQQQQQQGRGGTGGGGGAGTSSPPPSPPPPPELEARPSGVFVGDVDVLVHWLPPPPPPQPLTPRSSSSSSAAAAPPSPVPIALEADGPTHFARCPRTHPLGRTRVRNRTLRAAGLAVAVVPHWEWSKLVREEEAKGGGGALTAEWGHLGKRSWAAREGGGWCASEPVAARVAQLLDEAVARGEALLGEENEE
jgi:hypothetical protein